MARGIMPIGPTLLEGILGPFLDSIVGPLGGLWGGAGTSRLFSEVGYGICLYDPGMSRG